MSKILITGGSGFVGSVIVQHLSGLNHGITTIGISDTDDIYCNLATSIPEFNTYNFNWVIHLAGRAHSIPKTKEEHQLMFDINVQGTKNLCSAFEKISKPQSFIFISTVAVYGIDSGENINEEFPLNGTSAYALSKIQAEYFLQEWCERNHVVLGVVRPSLIAGKNPPGNLGQMIRGIKSGRYLSIGEGRTKKSILMAEDLARIIPNLAKKGGCYNLCDDHHPSLAELEKLIAKQLGKKEPISIPFWAANFMAMIGDMIGDKFPLNSLKLNKLVKPLTFSNKKAKQDLDWEPLDVLSNFRIS